MPEPQSTRSPDSRPQPPHSAASRPGPAAQRLRAPSWRDPRLLVGVLIVALSVSGVIALVTTQNRTTPVYAADRLLAVGDRLSVEDLRVVQVQIDELSEAYLPASGALPEDAELIAMVDEGELIPRRAVAEDDPQGRQAMTITVEHTLARGVEPGRLVDVWAADAGALGAQEEVAVEQLAARAQVSEITESNTTFGTQERVTVELLVDPEELPALLGATSSASTLSVVPAGAAGELDPEPAAEPDPDPDSNTDLDSDSDPDTDPDSDPDPEDET